MSIECRRENRQSLQGSVGGGGHHPSGMDHEWEDLEWEDQSHSHSHSESDPHVDGYFDAFDYDETTCPIDDECVVVSSKPPKATRRSVRFQTEDQVCMVESLVSSATDIWYTPQEFTQTTRELQVLIQRARRHNYRLVKESTTGSGTTITTTVAGDDDCSNDNDDYDMRGLEDIASIEANRNRARRMKAVVQGVLEEQALHQKDPVSISRRSLRVSREAQELALRRARCDARQARL